ncbi:hypothetical protein REPUB_Repub06bG0073700 [Reevesia pubescens]
MRRSLLSLLFVMAISATLFTEGLAANRKHLAAPPAQVWPWFPWGYRSGRALPPLPAHNWQQAQDPKVAKCLESFKAKVIICHQDFLHSFLSGKPSIGADCCAAIKAIEDDCSNLIARFNNPLFAHLLKKQCSNKGAAAPASA